MTWTSSSIDEAPPPAATPHRVRLPLTIWFAATVSRRTHRFSAMSHGFKSRRVVSTYDVGRPDRPVVRAPNPMPWMYANFAWLGFGYRLDAKLCLVQPGVPDDAGGLICEPNWQAYERLRSVAPDRLLSPAWPATSNVAATETQLAKARDAGLLTYDHDRLHRLSAVQPTEHVGYRPDSWFDPRSFAADRPALWRSTVRYVNLRVDNLTEHPTGVVYTPKQFAHSFLTGGFFHVVQDCVGNHQMAQLDTGRIVPRTPDRWAW